MPEADRTARWHYSDPDDSLAVAMRDLHRLWWPIDASGVKWVRRREVEGILSQLAARLRGPS